MTGSMLYDLNRYPYMLICLLESTRPTIHAKRRHNGPRIFNLPHHQGLTTTTPWTSFRLHMYYSLVTRTLDSHSANILHIIVTNLCS